jgi:hypothetical protein
MKLDKFRARLRGTDHINPNTGRPRRIDNVEITVFNDRGQPVQLGHPALPIHSPSHKVVAKSQSLADELRQLAAGNKDGLASIMVEGQLLWSKQRNCLVLATEDLHTRPRPDEPPPPEPRIAVKSGLTHIPVGSDAKVLYRHLELEDCPACTGKEEHEYVRGKTNLCVMCNGFGRRVQPPALVRLKEGM